MVGNGYGTADLPNALTDNRFTYAATNYFDPWGPFGGQLVDFDSTREPLLRIGHSFVYSPQASDANYAAPSRRTLSDSQTGRD